MKKNPEGFGQNSIHDIAHPHGKHYFCLENNYLYANGKDNIRPNQILLTGLFSVLMALVTSYGICSILGFFISPLHNFIPFLLLGLGVDDMFVIVQAFKQLEPAKGCLISESFSL